MESKRLIKIGSTILASIIILLLVVIVSIQLILTPKSLERIVGEFSKEYINGRVEADTIRLHIFKDFPYLTLSIQNGAITSGALDSLKNNEEKDIPAEADTLLKFKYLNISLSLPQLLSSNVHIRRITLVSPVVYAYLGPDSSSNFNIFKFPLEEETNTVEKDKSEQDAMHITVNRVRIRDGVKITYNSRPDSLILQLALDEASLNGTFSTELNKLKFNRISVAGFAIESNKQATIKDTLHTAKAEFSLDSLNINYLQNGIFSIAASSSTNLRMNDITLIDNFPIEMDGKIAFDTTQSISGKFEEFTLAIAKVPIIFNGSFTYTPDGITTKNLQGEVDGMMITDLFNYLPPNMKQLKDSIKSDAKLNIDVDINGTYNFKTGELPYISASVAIPQSQVEFIGKSSKINQLETDIQAYYSPTCQDSSIVAINKMVVNGRGLGFGASGKVTNFDSHNPLIQMRLTAEANLDTLSNLFPASSGSLFEGKIMGDLEVDSRLNNLNLYRLGNAGIRGSIKSERAKVIMPNEGVYAILSGINIVAGATKNKRDASIAKDMTMLATNSTADSIYIRYKDELMVAARAIRIAGHHTAEGFGGDTTQKRVLPLNGTVEAKRLDMRGADSIALAMRESKINFSILPFEEDYTIPAMRLEAKATSMRARGLENRYSIRDGGFAINAILNNKEFKKRDSLMRHHRSLTLKQHKRDKKSDFSNEDIDIRVDRSIGDIIRQWQISGNVTAKSGRVITPYFPQRTRMESLNIDFTTDNIDFTNTVIKSGESLFKLSGRVDGLKRAMLGRGNIRFNGTVSADTINFNQLLKAANAGMAYMNSSQAYKDSLSQEESEEAVAAIMEEATDSLASPLFVIPGNLNGHLTLDVKYGIYSKIVLHKIGGALTVMDRCLKISDFEASTNAGAMNMNAFYATRSKKDISTGFDLEFKDILVEKFIESSPAIDSLLPMLRSLEGRVNCQFSATSQLDTAMNFVIPSLKGVARITGDSLVLLDGETFAMIAKKLKFKNRERNLIDHVGVEMIINDSKIEIFPFMMEMDRYKFAMSGIQNLDLSFDYHISVLQSPIPFRLGVTLFGNMDDFDFKIGKAKYKSSKLPVYTALIDSTRVNLREQIANIYKIGVDAALRESREMKRLQMEKEKNNSSQPQEMEVLTEEELQQLEEIEPSVK